MTVQRALEQLRQERESFDLKKIHESRWFFLRLAMGYAAILLLAAVIVIAAYVLGHASLYSNYVVGAATSALFIDVLGLLVGVWKIALNPNYYEKLGPVTKENLRLHQHTNMDTEGEGKSKIDHNKKSQNLQTGVNPERNKTTNETTIT